MRQLGASVKSTSSSLLCDPEELMNFLEPGVKLDLEGPFQIQYSDSRSYNLPCSLMSSLSLGPMHGI